MKNNGILRGSKQKGSYIIITECRRKTEITVGKLGPITFPMGFYAYVGSAMSGLETRVGRHLRSNKTMHWHIDYLLQKAYPTTVITGDGGKGIECALAQVMTKNLSSIPHFGCSDCHCQSHLYFSSNKETILAEAIRSFYQVTIPIKIHSIPNHNTYAFTLRS